MDLCEVGSEARTALREIAGYLNFSTGASDPRFLLNLNLLWRLLQREPREPVEVLHGWLSGQLRELSLTDPAFGDIEQGLAITGLVFDHVLPAYREHHRHLLFHQKPASLWRPFFVGRVCEAVIAQEGPWDEPERITAGALARLNDFIGHRPVPVLENGRQMELYSHERVRPIPLFVRGAGVAAGRYEAVVAEALDVLRRAPKDVLEQAYFDPELLDELALDPRAYDFDHPVNKRPNYHFGQWDPHLIDRSGRYRRFVLQEMSLAAVQQRLDDAGDADRSELLREAGAVLAGIILMAAGTSGRGPDTHDSSVTLAKLLPQIARYRDKFYKWFLQQVEGEHGARLRIEARAQHQPLGGARRHLNQQLARLRATQLQHVHLAQLFARMGYPEASTRQAQIVPVASARMLCEINGRLTTGHRALDRNDVETAAKNLAEAEELLHDAIECGAVIDPWNILGFQGQFSLFPAMENTVHDHRADVLVHLLRQILGLYARTQAEAAAAGLTELEQRMAAATKARAAWWDQFATTEVSSVESFSGREAAESARQVAKVLAAWQRAGAAAGDLAFWRKQVDGFQLPKSYALVVQTLLEKQDLVAARALLVQWLSQAEHVPLAEGDYSFHSLALKLVQEICGAPTEPLNDDRWKQIVKFLESLEANADEYWNVPHLDQPITEAPADDEEEKNPYRAAYDEVTYRDSTDDGQQGNTFDGTTLHEEFTLEQEAPRIDRRLGFLIAIARVWKVVASRTARVGQADRDEVLSSWIAQAARNRKQLLALLDAADKLRVPPPHATQESRLEYDRRRMIKESFIARIISTCLETCDACRMLQAAMTNPAPNTELPAWQLATVRVLSAILRGDQAAASETLPELTSALAEQHILYVPLAKGGKPRKIVLAQALQQVLAELLQGLPSLGLIKETCDLIALAQSLEKHRPEGESAVTEFDRLFEVGYRALVECLVAATPSSPAAADSEFIDCLQRLTEGLLKRWLGHSRSLRLSALEKIQETDKWQATREFIERYGHDLFTQPFLNIGNLRAILHQGVDAFLKRVEQDTDDDSPRLLRDLAEGKADRAKVVEALQVTLEAIVENYAEYKDFNSTTTQSDRGELLYTLLDLLRIKASYERFVWNIRPVLVAHEVLLRRGRTAAAELWRRAVAERTAEIADWHLQKFDDLSRQYGVRLPTIADRLGERFVRQLAIDRMLALVEPAIEQARSGHAGSEPRAAFAALEEELGDFTSHPTGVGLDAPLWLSALEQEVAAHAHPAAFAIDPLNALPRHTIELADAMRQIEAWETGA